MWPFIADLYTPLLVIAVCWTALKAGRIRAAVVLLLLCSGLIYGFSFMELSLGLWHSWGLDYSTHSAILLPFYQMLWLLSLLPVTGGDAETDADHKNRWWVGVKRFITLIFALATGAAYAVLMMQLGYHSFADILTTVISTYPLVWICFHLLRPSVITPQQTA